MNRPLASPGRACRLALAVVTPPRSSTRRPPLAHSTLIAEGAWVFHVGAAGPQPSGIATQALGGTDFTVSASYLGGRFLDFLLFTRTMSVPIESEA